jgi:hypothetical protein
LQQDQLLGIGKDGSADTAQNRRDIARQGPCSKALRACRTNLSASSGR